MTRDVEYPKIFLQVVSQNGWRSQSIITHTRRSVTPFYMKAMWTTENSTLLWKQMY